MTAANQQLLYLECRKRAEQHARDVLALAQVGGMPDTFWGTDSRVQRALETLEITAHDALTIDWVNET